jgi:hypothetical protein
MDILTFETKRMDQHNSYSRQDITNCGLQIFILLEKLFYVQPRKQKITQ